MFVIRECLLYCNTNLHVDISSYIHILFIRVHNNGGDDNKVSSKATDLLNQGLRSSAARRL